MTTPWEAYRDVNPMLTEMREYNTRVRDRVLAKKTTKLTAPSPERTEVQDRADGPGAYASARLGKSKLKSQAKIEFTDRYKAMGIPYPDPKTMCKGQCEGTGLVPIKGKNWEEKDSRFAAIASDAGPSSQDEAYQKLWDEAEKTSPTDDGWHFVKCIDCGGTGKRTEESLGSCLDDLRNLLG